jgi:methylated-DNA-protein-cysteine methyltransferase-like protein
MPYYKSMPTDFQNSIYKLVKRIPRGKVATYGQIAYLLGRPWAFRAVGSALHRNNDPLVPCHRVVNRDGRLARNFGLGGREEQKRRLVAEGVKFSKEYQVELKRFVWKRVFSSGYRTG